MCSANEWLRPGLRRRLSNLSIATPAPSALFARAIDYFGIPLGFLAQKYAWQPQADGALVAHVEAELHELFAADFRLDELAVVEQFDSDAVPERGYESDDRRAGKYGVSLVGRP